MPIDAQIPLQTKVADIDPIASYGKMMQLRSIGQESQLRDLQLKREIKEASDQAALEAALSATGDPDEAVGKLFSSGKGTAGLKLQQAVLTQRKARLEAQKLEIEGAEKKSEMAGQILGGVKDDATLQLAKQSLMPLLGPQAVAMLGDTYDKDHIQSIADMHTKTSDRIRARHYAVTEAQKDLDQLLTAAKDAPVTAEKWRELIGKRISLAPNAEEAKNLLGMYAGVAPKSVLQEFEGMTPQQAGEMLKSPHERTTEQQGAERNRIAWSQLSVSQQRAREEQWRDLLNTGVAFMNPNGVPPQPGAPSRVPSSGGNAPTSGAPAPAAAPAPNPVAQMVGPDTHGDEVLKQLPPQLAETVKAYAEGRRKVPSGFAQKTPYFQNLLNLVMQYDPTFDEHRYDYLKDFNSPNSKTGQSIGALNTTMQHLELLDQLSDALGNKNMQTYNKIANRLKTEFGWTGQTDFDTVAPQLVKEIERTWRGSGGSAGEISDMLEKSMNTKFSRDQQRSALVNAVKLVEGKLKSLEFQRDESLGVAAKQVKIVSPETQKILDKFAPGEPDLKDLPQGKMRNFTAGPFKGQSWTKGPDGKPVRVK